MKKPDLYNNTGLLWALLGVFLLVWFYMLGARTLVPTDEGRYAQMAREMLASGDWITLRLNGIKYFEKPPLQNWMNALTFAVFGLGEWQARLWTGLSGLLGILMTGYAGAKVFNRQVGITAAMVLASSFYWANMGHVNSLDMGLSGMMTVSLTALLLAQRPGISASANRNWMLLCWLGMALATLSKGLIGIVLPGAVLVLYTLICRDWALWQRLHLVKGTLLFFAVCTPWFVLIALKNPEHPHFFFIHEHFQRFTSTVHKRGGPWYYFIPLLLIGIIPWLGSLFSALMQGLRSDLTLSSSISQFQPKRLILIWAAFLFFFFSISGSKLPGYILPIFPALALLIAADIHHKSAKSLQWAAASFSLLGLAGFIGLHFFSQTPAYLADTIEAGLNRGYLPWLAGVAIFMLVTGMIAVVLARKGQKEATIITLAFAGFMAGQVAALGHEPWGQHIAGSKHLPAMQAYLQQHPQAPIFAVGRYEQALPFYLQRTTTLVEFADEMGFGLSIQPELWIPVLDDFIAKWKTLQSQGQPAMAIVRTDIYEKFKQSDFPMQVIGIDSKRVIISNGTGVKP